MKRRKTDADPVEELARAMKSGAITPDQAAERLFDLAMSLGPIRNLPPDVKARTREAMRTALRTDPRLAARARRLGMTTDDDDD